MLKKKMFNVSEVEIRWCVVAETSNETGEIRIVRKQERPRKPRRSNTVVPAEVRTAQNR